MKTLHLHIGLPKTATTLIQNSLQAGAHVLAEKGLHYAAHYPEHFGDAGHHMLVMGILGERGRPIRVRVPLEELSKAWPQALRRFDAVPQQAIFVSSELFSFAINDPDDIATLRNTLADYRVHVILVLRDVADFVDSVYAQRLKGGFDGNVADFVTRNWANLHWREMTQKWARVFGRANMTVLDFADLKSGNLVVNFARAGLGLDLSEADFPVGTANPALPYHAAQLVREVNASDLPNRVKIEFRLHMRDFFNAHGTQGTFRKARFLSEDSRAILRNWCQWPKIDGRD